MAHIKRGILILMLSAFVALAAVGADAAMLEKIAQPCRAKNILAGRLVKDRATGRDMFVLSNSNEESGIELIFIDIERNTAKVYHAPAGSGSWAISEVPGDRMVVGTYYDGVFMVFDLKKMEFIKTIPFPGESYIWNLAMGSDGRIYGGTYEGGKLGALDLNTYTVEDCGAPAPPNLYLRYVSPTPDGRIYCMFTTEKPAYMLYDPTAKKWEDAPKQLQGVAAGTVWNGYFVTGTHAFKGRELAEVDPLPFPTPPEDKGKWSIDTTLTTPDTLFIRQKTIIYCYKAGDKDLTLITDMALRQGALYAATSKGNVLGVRGQDYFIIKPGDKNLQLKPIPAEASPRPILFLRVDPEGKIWGGPYFGQTLFWTDPTTGKTVNTSTVCDEGGEVYDVAFSGGKVYAVAYAGGDIIEYDPKQSWDQWHVKNPRVIAKVGGEYIRPEAGVKLGPDGKLYSAWLAKYGVYGGAVSITDIKTGATELIKNPLGEQGLSGVDTDGKFIYVSSTLAGNGLPIKKGDSPKFGVIDPTTKKVIFERIFDGKASVSIPVYDRATKRVVVVANGTVSLFDTAQQKFVEGLPDIPNMSSRKIASAGDGVITYGNEKSLVRLDLATGISTVMLEAPSNITNVAIGPDGTIYLTCGVDLYRVK